MEVLIEVTERVRATHLRPVDVILVQLEQRTRAVWGRVNGEDVVIDREPYQVLCFAGRKAPRRAFWIVVKRTERVPGGTGLKAVIVDFNGQPYRMRAKGDIAVTRLLKLSRG